MDLKFLRSIELFRNLNAVQVAHLASVSQEQTLKRGTILFREKDKAEHFFVLREGKIRISKIVPGIGEEALAVLEPGSYFGEMEFIDPEITRAAQAMAHENSVVQVFAYDDIRELLASDPELAQAFLWSFVKTLSQRLRDTNDKVTAMFAMAQFG